MAELSPPQRLRDALEWRRDGDAFRKGGVPFDGAWEVATAEVLKRCEETGWWREVFESQRASWERAYCGLPPTAGDRALALLGEGRVPFDTSEKPVCAHCDGEIPASRLRHHADFCSEGCRKAASWVRERERKAA
jgi:hypothetical protein